MISVVWYQTVDAYINIMTSCKFIGCLKDLICSIHWWKDRFGESELSELMNVIERNNEKTVYNVNKEELCL